MTIPSATYQLQSTDLTLSDVLQIDGTMEFDPRTSVTITTTKNVVVTGKLISRPNPNVTHLINFVKIDESKFIGGGDTVLDSDIGLYAIGDGQLDLQGSLRDEWNDGGPIVGAIDSLVTRAGNLNRNMRIEGTATGRSHIFIKSSKPQTIRYVGLRWLGPRKARTGDTVKSLVTGRYAIHFHHAGDGSRGSIIEGCIAKDCGNHTFVPHGSSGITMRGNAALNNFETAFWYDAGHKTDDLIWENNLVANISYVERSYNQDTDSPTFGAGGFYLGFGDGNICRNNVVYKTSGSGGGAAAYIWPELRDDADTSKDLTSTWIFTGNLAIDCPLGIDVWQNSEHHHTVQNTTIVNCPIAILHGAYGNHYKYLRVKIINGVIDLRAASDNTIRVRFEECEIDAGGQDACVLVNENPGKGMAPVLFRACKFTNFRLKAIIDQNPGPGTKTIDVVDCSLPVTAYKVSSAAVSGEWIRVQEQGKAWKITKSGTTSIALFAPTIWGTGTGLKAEYFKLIPSTVAGQGPTFGDKVLEREEPTVNVFDLTHPQIHYAVPAAYGARWSGKIQPQYAEAYTFYCYAGGGIRLWIDNKLIIDKWAERYPGDVKALFGAMIPGKLYDIKLEYFNLDERSKCTLEWSCPSLPREFVPMSQLYSDAIVLPPNNKAPISDAGIDQKIEVSTILYGTGKDPEGGVLTYKWEQVKGVPAVIATPAAATTKVTGLSPGENIFRLTVTDEKGASGSDEVSVVVQ